MLALSRLCAILHLSIVMPHRWLAGNSHRLGEHGWSVRSMGRALDALEKAMLVLEERGECVLDEEFMMGIFDKIKEELPEFSDYMEHMYDEKAHVVVGGAAPSVHSFSELRDELFCPTAQCNRDTDHVVRMLAGTAAATIVVEMGDEKKATHNHLSSADGKWSWEQTTDAEHEAGKGKLAVNDPAESSLGRTTRQLQAYGRISIGNAGGVAQSNANRDLDRGASELSKPSKRRKAGVPDLGYFHSLPPKEKESLLRYAVSYAATMRAVERADLVEQRAVKLAKEEALRQAGLESATEEYIDAIYYRTMYDSPARWRTPADVTREVGKLKSKSAKLAALKEQIRIRTLGLGWADLHHAWSKDGTDFEPRVLALHLKVIIAAEATRPIPSTPPVPLPARKVLPTLGETACDVAALDAKQMDGAAAFDQKARAEVERREAEGEGDRYEQCQPTSRPAVATLLGKRLDYLFEYAHASGGGSDLRWSQGVVTLVSDGTNIYKPGAVSAKFKAGEGVNIKWDACPGRGEAESSTTAVALLPSKWNPRSGEPREGWWRLDVGGEGGR